MRGMIPVQLPLSPLPFPPQREALSAHNLKAGMKKAFRAPHKAMITPDSDLQFLTYEVRNFFT